MQTHSEITCPLCGCLCDDLTVKVDANRIVDVTRGCRTADSVFRIIGTTPLPVARIEGESVNVEAAFEKAVEFLLASRSPLIFGMDFTTTEDQRSAIHLAETLGGVIDTGGGVLTRASLLAMQQTGISTCTLGEIRQRADLVIIWGADPEVTHPRFFERFLQPGSEFLPNGRSDRTIVCINDRETQSGSLADQVIKLPAQRTAEAIGALRYWLRKEGELPNPPPPKVKDALPLEELQGLVRRMKSCRYGVILFGEELTTDPAVHLTLQGLFSLVAELNEFTRFVVRGLGKSGAENVLAWQTGFPLAVDFQQGVPRYQPGEFSARERIERGEVDCCIVVGAESLATLIQHSEHRAQEPIPTIFLNPTQVEVPPGRNRVDFAAAFPGIQSEGTMYRMDDVPLPVRKVIDSPCLTVSEILEELRQRVEKAASFIAQGGYDDPAKGCSSS